MLQNWIKTWKNVWEILNIIKDFQTIIEEVSETETLIWKSNIWSWKNEAVWQIFKIIENWNETQIVYANWEETFNKVWENRNTYVYSIV
jgi:hypothetical protein